MSSPFLSSAARAAIRRVRYSSCVLLRSRILCGSTRRDRDGRGRLDVAGGSPTTVGPEVRGEQPRDRGDHERDARPGVRADDAARGRHDALGPSRTSVEIAGAQDPRGRGRDEEVDRLARRDAAPQVGRRDVAGGACGPARPRQPGGIGSGDVVPVDDRERHGAPELVDPVPRVESTPRHRSRRSRNSSRSGARRAPRPCRSCRSGPSRSISIRDASSPVDAVERGRDHLEAGLAPARTTRPRFCHGSPATTTSTRSRPSWSRAAAAATRCATWTGSKVPPRMPRRSDRTGECTRRPREPCVARHATCNVAVTAVRAVTPA